VGWLNSQFPTAWQGPVLYISAVLALTLALRLTALILGVWQGRSFTLIAKDVIFRMREQMLLRLSRIAMSEYETLGSGAVASHFVKDLDAMDTFIGASVFLRNRTTLIIAHRLSAVKQADRAYVFDGGQIIEEGMHDELIRGDGLYSRLYGQLQH
jgi:ABC-type multidrug transport system fused ATPase/permease subunit